MDHIPDSWFGTASFSWRFAVGLRSVLVTLSHQLLWRCEDSGVEGLGSKVLGVW